MRCKGEQRQEDEEQEGNEERNHHTHLHNDREVNAGRRVAWEVCQIMHGFQHSAELLELQRLKGSLQNKNYLV